jgi:hypothetical protein
VSVDVAPSDSALGTVIEKPLFLAIMPRVCVDKQTGTTAATKKRVDKRYLIWYKTGWKPAVCGKPDRNWQFSAISGAKPPAMRSASEQNDWGIRRKIASRQGEAVSESC